MEPDVFDNSIVFEMKIEYDKATMQSQPKGVLSGLYSLTTEKFVPSISENEQLKSTPTIYMKRKCCSGEMKEDTNIASLDEPLIKKSIYPNPIKIQTLAFLYNDTDIKKQLEDNKQFLPLLLEFYHTANNFGLDNKVAKIKQYLENVTLEELRIIANNSDILMTQLLEAKLTVTNELPNRWFQQPFSMTHKTQKSNFVIFAMEYFKKHQKWFCYDKLHEHALKFQFETDSINQVLFIPVHYDHFLEEFKQFTYNVIDINTFPWQKVICLGGAIERCIRKTAVIGSTDDFSDVDFFTTEQSNIADVVMYFRSLKAKVYISIKPTELIFSIQNVKRHFAVFYDSNISYTDAIDLFDFAHNQVIFNGRQALAFPKAISAWENSELILNRASHANQSRYFKAFLKGYVNLDKFDDKLNPYCYYNTFLKWKSMNHHLILHDRLFYPSDTYTNQENTLKLTNSLNAYRTQLLSDIDKEEMFKIINSLESCSMSTSVVDSCNWIQNY